MINTLDSTSLVNIILDNIYDGIVVVDNSAKIVFINQPYAEFLGENKETFIGKNVTDCIDNTRLHVILETRSEEIGELQDIKGNKVVVRRAPIFNNGKIIGAIGKIIFKDIKELDIFSAKIHRIENELQYYKKALKEERETKYNFDNIIGNSNKMKATKYLAKKAAQTSSNVLICGESGTGKELFAHAVHSESNRAMGPFVKVNCAAIPYELLESELFGYEEGAFTGAKKGGKIGKFELANGGSIFLDEIGDMPISMQVKLLRVIQEKEIERVGGVKSIPLDVRIIAATNKNLEELVKNGKFREDLFYRLNVMNINIPALRERKEDIAVLVKFLMVKISEQVGNYVVKISNKAMKYLERYSWPGNVRELENVLERAINLIEYSSEIQVEDLPLHITKQKVGMEKNKYNKLKDILDDVEKRTILEVLDQTRGNRSETAKILNISRSSLYEKLWKYGIEEKHKVRL